MRRAIPILSSIAIFGIAAGYWLHQETPKQSGLQQDAGGPLNAEAAGLSLLDSGTPGADGGAAPAPVATAEGGQDGAAADASERTDALGASTRSIGVGITTTCASVDGVLQDARPSHSYADWADTGLRIWDDAPSAFRAACQAKRDPDDGVLHCTARKRGALLSNDRMYDRPRLFLRYPDFGGEGADEDLLINEFDVELDGNAPYRAKCGVCNDREVGVKSQYLRELSSEPAALAARVLVEHQVYGSSKDEPSSCECKMITALIVAVKGSGRSEIERVTPSGADHHVFYSRAIQQVFWRERFVSTRSWNVRKAANVANEFLVTMEDPGGNTCQISFLKDLGTLDGGGG